MKTVTRYVSDSGFEFETKEQAEKENLIFANERELAKSYGESLYTCRADIMGWVQATSGRPRAVTYH